MEEQQNILLYQNADGNIKLDVHLEDESVWVTQEQMAQLFGKAKSTISEHIKNIFKEKELDENSVVRNFRTTASDGKKYATNFYNDESTKLFFATVQNKMHFAIHGQTAAEMINSRADADKAFLGLTNFKGDYITQRDIGIAKNYLSENELKQLNLIVSMYLDFAEFQAGNGRLMKMKD